jgi:hypothetical protein
MFQHTQQLHVITSQDVRAAAKADKKSIARAKFANIDGA